MRFRAFRVYRLIGFRSLGLRAYMVLIPSPISPKP